MKLSNLTSNSVSVVVTNPETLRIIIRAAFDDAVSESLPDLVRKATTKQYLTGQEAQEYMGLSRRKLQYLRDTRQIPFVQHGRKILYPSDGIEQFLQDHRISVRPSRSDNQHILGEG